MVKFPTVEARIRRDQREKEPSSSFLMGVPQDSGNDSDVPSPGGNVGI